ncbi:E3 ubiquitin-protein ligase PDZRN3, partial [Biomphalaria glabrata]
MGFDSAKFVTSVADDKKCLMCHGVLDNPVRSPCGHVFCSSCIQPWLAKHGACPKKCRAIGPNDLENVLPLREVILNLKVKCEFFEYGCTQTSRLTDLFRHTQRCGYKPVACSNPGCEMVLCQKDIYLHESEKCSCRPVGECDKGCGLLLHLNTLNAHDCYQALKALVKSQEDQLKDLREKLTVVSTKFSTKEQGLLDKVSALNRQLVEQSKSERDATVKEANSELNGEFAWRRVTLHRDQFGSLGFNIMGGYT